MKEIDSSIKDSYRSISSMSKGIFKDNGSKFLAFAFPVETEEEIKTVIQDIKKEYFDARHHCYAWRLGYDGARWRANDDGEPSSSAGRPILGQILSNDLSDILIVVVRYFGGIKLGIPGLIRAYRESSSEAIGAAEIIEKIAKSTYILEYGYLNMNDIMKVVKDMSLEVSGQKFEMNCSLTVRVRLAAEEKFIENIRNIESVTLTKV